MYVQFTSCVYGELFHDGDPYHIQTYSLISSANQQTSFQMIRTSVTKFLPHESKFQFKIRLFQNIFLKLLKISQGFSKAGNVWKVSLLLFAFAEKSLDGELKIDELSILEKIEKINKGIPGLFIFYNLFLVCCICYKQPFHRGTYRILSNM